MQDIKKLTRKSPEKAPHICKENLVSKKTILIHLEMPQMNGIKKYTKVPDVERIEKTRNICNKNKERLFVSPIEKTHKVEDLLE